MALVKLPLPLDALPEAIRRFADPSVPGPARTMAARGMVPGLRGENLVTLLVQLGHDKDPAIAPVAQASLGALPEGVLFAACEAALLPSILDGLATIFSDREEMLERVIANMTTPDETVERVAAFCTERIAERIATNEQRMLRFPLIIEALYKNPTTRMSTADRLVDLAVRNNVDLPGIPAFRAHAEALAGELLPEPSEEPLPSDQVFKEALEADQNDPEAFVYEGPEEEKVEKVKEDHRPLHARIKTMRVPEKIRLAMVGDATARAMLVRDPKRVVAMAAIASPRMQPNEALSVAKSKEMSEEILRFVARKKEWVQQYDIKRALIFNPKTPVAVSLQWLSHLQAADVKTLAKSRGIPAPLKTAATQRLQKKEKKD